MATLLLALFGCGDPADTAGVDSGDACAGVPVLSWQSFGQGFMTENCQGCHASTNVDHRYGAPESVTFDTAAECWAQKDAILSVATGDDPTMPPSGGPDDDDRTRLAWWLECAPTGT